MSADQLHILYCDDQERFREEFLARHRDRFEIETTDKIVSVLPDLLSRRQEELPDLLLLDLYHDIDSSNDDAARPAGRWGHRRRRSTVAGARPSRGRRSRGPNRPAR
jgi:hypothetical protein